MERDRLEQEHHMERGHVENGTSQGLHGTSHGSIMDPSFSFALPLTKLVEDDSDFLSMLCGQNVSQESCFS